MSYTDQAALVELFDEHELQAMADRDGDQVIDSTLIARVIARADSMIDGRLRARYTLPLAEPVDPMLSGLAEDICRYLLQDDNPLDVVKARYEAALKTLRDIEQGRIHLDVPGTTAGLVVAIKAPGRLFTHDTLASF